jgi:hypothetical protein
VDPHSFDADPDLAFSKKFDPDSDSEAECYFLQKLCGFCKIKLILPIYKANFSSLKNKTKILFMFQLTFFNQETYLNAK